MTERIIAECRDYQQLIMAFRGWIDELGTHGEAVDYVAGLPLRYTMKLLGPAQVKNIGRTSLGPLLGALGLKLVVAVDHAVLERIRHRLTQRRNALTTMLSQGKRRKRRRYLAFKGNTELSRMLYAQHLLLSTPEQRSMIARNAANARWSRQKSMPGETGGFAGRGGKSKSTASNRV